VGFVSVRQVFVLVRQVLSMTSRCCLQRARVGFSLLGRLSVLDGQSHCQAVVCVAKQVLIVDKQVLVGAGWVLSFVRQVFVLSRQVFVRARRVFQGRPVLDGQSHCQVLVCAARRCLSVLGSVANVKEIFVLTIRLFVNPDFS
jgi:hypothetical protein